MMRLVRAAALAMTLPVASLWGLFGGCDNCVVDYFQPAIDVYKNGDYYVGADLLYWTHSDCDYGYVATIGDILQVPSAGAPPVAPPNINVFASRNNIEFVKPGYEPGVRIHFGFNIAGCLNQELNYTWLEVSDTDATRLNVNSPLQLLEPTFIVNNSFALAFAGPADKITGEVFSRYQRVVWNMGVNFCNGDWGYFQAGGTPQWVGISHKRTTTAHFPSLGQTFTDTQKSTFSAGGVGYYVGYKVHLNKCGLFSVGKVQVNTVLSRQRMTRTGVATLASAAGQPVPIFEELTIPGRTCFVPGFEASCGVGWTKQCKCFKVNVQFEYEIQHWINALSYRIGGNQVVPSAKEDILFGGIAYGGPSLRLDVGY